ncbi:Protein of unknown function [Gryllus bimaculatus]|nr:Protein of unknown function [Gryllus bimaculatus]
MLAVGKRSPCFLTRWGLRVPWRDPAERTRDGSAGSKKTKGVHLGSFELPFIPNAFRELDVDFEHTYSTELSEVLLCSEGNDLLLRKVIIRFKNKLVSLTAKL